VCDEAMRECSLGLGAWFLGFPLCKRLHASEDRQRSPLLTGGVAPLLATKPSR
jgi:hypothetical protein